MELQDVLRGAGTCRHFLTDPVDDTVLEQLFDAARFAPQGGNRQPVRYVVVRDPQAKRTLRDWYLEPWKAYLAGTQTGAVRVGGERAQRAVADADHMAERLHEVPVLVVVCAVLADLTIPDAQLARPAIAGGASVYPAVQNLLLTARELGLGAALTTLLCSRDADVRGLLGIPDDVATAATIALGWPARPLHRRLTRRPVAEVVFAERYGRRLWDDAAG